MEVKEALIPSKGNSDFLLKLFNSHPAVGKRDFTEHKHVACEIVLFKSGSGTYRTIDRSYAIQKDDIFLYGSNEIHYITEINAPMSLMNIHFEPRFIWSSGNDLFDAKYLQIFFNRNMNFQNRLDRDNPATNTIKKLLLKMENEFYDKNTEYALMVKVQLLTILVTLIRNYDYVNINKNSAFIKTNNFEMIEKSMEYINRHLTDELTLKKLSSIANMRDTYYCAVFKKLNGISPWDYIIAKRIEYATQQLKNYTGTMLELALTSGFNNTANFNRAFRKCTGKTPREFKQQDNIEF